LDFLNFTSIGLKGHKVQDDDVVHEVRTLELRYYPGWSVLWAYPKTDLSPKEEVEIPCTGIRPCVEGTQNVKIITDPSWDPK